MVINKFLAALSSMRRWFPFVVLCVGGNRPIHWQADRLDDSSTTTSDPEIPTNETTLSAGWERPRAVSQLTGKRHFNYTQAFLLMLEQETRFVIYEDGAYRPFARLKALPSWSSPHAWGSWLLYLLSFGYFDTMYEIFQRVFVRTDIGLTLFQVVHLAAIKKCQSHWFQRLSRCLLPIFFLLYYKKMLIDQLTLCWGNIRDLTRSEKEWRELLEKAEKNFEKDKEKVTKLLSEYPWLVYALKYALKVSETYSGQIIQILFLAKPIQRLFYVLYPLYGSAVLKKQPRFAIYRSACVTVLYVLGISYIQAGVWRSSDPNGWYASYKKKQKKAILNKMKNINEAYLSKMLDDALIGLIAWPISLFVDVWLATFLIGLLSQTLNLFLQQVGKQILLGGIE